ncbi:MAG TPA: type II toxin-antitoxin system VapC family toxin [Sphingomicrobium sp.]|nr:type II toxin-antitoxin system VapC family toxin [Sphingomicrobium sp.]
MRAIDTNVLVRFLTKDDPEQYVRAKALIEGGDIFVATTVLLEAEWVLRSGYAYTRMDIVNALRSFAGLPGITLENPNVAAQALAWSENGMDFADALHLASSSPHGTFHTFDTRLIKAAPEGTVSLS